jgi:hypothetical protein
MNGPRGEFGERLLAISVGATLHAPLRRASRRYFDVRGKCFSRQPRMPPSMESTSV